MEKMNTLRLDGKTQVPCSEQEWLDQLHNIGERRVGKDLVLFTTVSTVFVGNDAEYDFEQEQDEKRKNKGMRKVLWSEKQGPRAFETCVFGWPQNYWQFKYVGKYGSWEDARQGHQEIVEKVRSEINGWLLKATGTGLAIMAFVKLLSLTM